MPDESPPTIRAALERLIRMLEAPRDEYEYYDAMVAARAALAAAPEGEPSDEQLTLTYAYAVAAAVGGKRGPFNPEDAERAQLAGLRTVLSRWGRPAAPLKPVAYIHRQGKHWEVSERLLQDDERARGWTEEPLYAALAAAPEGEPSDEELLAMRSWSCHGPTFDSDLVDFARAVLSRWAHPAAPPAPLEGEKGELAEWLYRLADERTCNRRRGIRPHPSALTRAAVLLQQPSAAAPAAPLEGEGPSDDQWDALVERVWDKYETVDHQGERFMYASDFGNALDLVRKELARWGRSAAPPAPPEGEVGELVEWLRRLCAASWIADVTHDKLLAIATLLEQLSAAAPAVVPVPVSERLPGEDDRDGEGFCWFWSPGDRCWFWERIESDFCRRYGAEFEWLPAHAIPLPAPQGVEGEA